MAENKSYQFGPVLTDRIISVVKRVDSMPYQAGLSRIPTRFEDEPSPGQKLKRGTYTGSWAIGTTAVVTLVGSTQTYAVTNYCIDAEGSTASSASFNVVFGSVMGTQTAVEVESPPKDIIRACTFSGSWAINETKTLTFQGSTTTAAAWNQLFTIGDACTEQIAYIAKVPTVEQQNNPAWHLLNVQHHETAVITSVSLTTAAIEFTRILTWIPYPGETATLSLPISAETACS
jgi:hypothetical protein